MLSTKEIDAIRFYQGDVRKRDEKGKILENTTNDGIYGIHSAYRTINCLMFDGVENEKERIKEKNGALAPELFREIDKVIEIYCDIFRAMCKCVAESKSKITKLVYRTERSVSVEELKKGYTVSFTSTSKENKPEDFLKKKSGLVLMNIVIPPDIPYLDFEQILGDEYQYRQQKEVLLPPYLKIELEEMELSEEEKAYRDVDGKPPKAKYLVLIKGFRNKSEEKDNITREPLKQECNIRAAEILEKLINQQPLTNQEKEIYCSWKRDVREIIWNAFMDIRKEYLDEYKDLARRENLLSEIEQIRKEFDIKRKRYKSRIRWYHLGLIAVNTIPIVLVALSFIDSIQVIMKIMAIIAGAVSVFLTQTMRVEVYNEKLMQRSKTYLKLCDLKREIKYERVWNDKKGDEYVRKYRDIMIADMEMSLHNLETQTKNGYELYQSDIKTEYV